MTKEEKQIQAELKRLNTRIATIYKVFGGDSYYYNRLINQFYNSELGRKGKLDDLVHKTSKGIFQLNTNVGSIRSVNNEYLMNIARKHAKTISAIRKEVRKEGKESIKDVAEEREKRTEMEQRLNNKVTFLYNNYTESERREIAPELYEEGKLSYNQIYDVMVNIERRRLLDEIEDSDYTEAQERELKNMIYSTDDVDLLEEMDFKNDNPFEDDEQ